MLQQTKSHPKLAEYLTVGEAAEYLGVSPWTLRNWDKAGKLKPRRHPKNGYRIYRHEDLAAVLEAGEGRADPLTDAPAPVDWRAMGEREHFVQFYEHDGFLTDSVSGYVGAALAEGDVGVVIATAAHRSEIEAKLSARGIDVPGAVAAGQYILLDAAETLKRFMIDGLPDADRFAMAIGGMVAKATAGRRRLRAFGEMVALLWADGNRAGAIRLEQLWNELGKKHAFALFCAYPLAGFGAAADGAGLSEVCTCHARVIPAESYGSLGDANDRMRAVTLLQQRAASLEAEIAHRQEVERDLERRERELSDFLENAAEGLHQVGPDGRVLWANRAELELLGYAPREFVGHHISKFHADRGVIEEMLARLMRGEALVNHPARMLHRDGSIRHMLVNSNGCFDDDGRFLHSRCFTRDVTDRRLAEERQREILESERAARAQAERVSRMKDEFLATLSHELRTPLNAIYGWTGIIKKSPADAETVAEGIAVIDRNVRAQIQLIEDLLDMSRIVSGKLRLDVQRVELATVAEAAVAAARPSAEAKEIRLRTALDPQAGPVAGDPNRLQQVIWNLLSNAVKFTPRGGQVELRLARVDGHVEITVADTGQGIPPEFLPHVFERFRQADGSITRKHGGLGLGLAIVKQLVELHGGSVRVASAGAGMGASFTVSFPLPVERSSGPPAADAPAAADLVDDVSIRLAGVTVLVVDDEPDTRQLIGRLLADREALVLTAASADEAMDILRRERPQVIVSDIGMPGTDGYQFIRAVRALHEADGGQVRALALTAFARSQDRTRALLAGYQAHMSKPVDPQELVVTVASLADLACR